MKSDKIYLSLTLIILLTAFSWFTSCTHIAKNNYADIIREITPGNPDASRIYQTIIAKWGNRMPPKQPLSLENRTKIRVWIEQGATLTTCADTTGTGGNGGGGNTYVARAC